MRFWNSNPAPAAAPEAKSFLTADTLDPSLAAWLDYRPAASGVPVTAKTAMRAPGVRACVTLIAETVGALPLHVFKRGADGARERDPSHPIERLIGDVANPWTSSQDLWEAIMLDALTHDDGGFAVIARGDGQPSELHRIDPTTVRIDFDGINPPIYRVRLTPESPEVPYSHMDVIHVTSGCKSPISDAREAIGVALALERHAASLFGEAGGKPAGILRNDKATGEKGHAVITKLKAAWQATFSAGRSGGVVTMDDGWDFKPLTFSSTDSEFLAHRQFANEEIARAFRVPSPLIGQLDRATWSNFTETKQLFLDTCLNPWLLRIENQIRLKLLADSADVFAEFERAALERMNLQTRMAAYSVAITSRVMNPNEVRQRENLPPYPAGNEFVNPAITPKPAAGNQDNGND